MMLEDFEKKAPFLAIVYDQLWITNGISSEYFNITQANLLWNVEKFFCLNTNKSEFGIKNFYTFPFERNSSKIFFVPVVMKN